MSINRLTVVFAGTLCLFFGIFLPFATAPIVGSVTLLAYSLTYTFLLLLAILATWLFAYLKAFTFLRDLSALLLVVFIVAIVYFEYTMHQKVNALSQSLQGNPFGGLATAAMGAIHLDIGAAVLTLGAVLLVVSSFLKTADAVTTSEAQEAHGVGLFVGQQLRDNRPVAVGVIAMALLALGGSIYIDHQSAVTRGAALAAQEEDATTTTPAVPNSQDNSNSEAAVNQLNAVVSVQPLQKDFHMSDPSNGDYQDSLVLILQYHNLTRKRLSAFKGSLELTNKFGDRIQGFQVDYEKPLSPGAVVTETTYYDYNQFESGNVNARNTPLSDMRFRWIPTKVLFADGQSMSNQ